MIPSCIRCDLMSLTECCLPLPHLTHEQKYFPCITCAFRCTNCKNSSTPFSYSSLICDAFIQLRSMFRIQWYSQGYPICMKISLFHTKVSPYLIQEDIFYTWFICTSLVRYIKFDEILAMFHTDLQSTWHENGEMNSP